MTRHLIHFALIVSIFIGRLAYSIELDEDELEKTFSLLADEVLILNKRVQEKLSPTIENTTKNSHFVKYIKELIEEEKIDIRILHSSKEHANLWVRIKSTEKKKPLIILIGKDTRFISSVFTVFKFLSAQKIKLTRDLIFVLTAPERNDEKNGITWMREHHSRLLSSDAVWSEGGEIMMKRRDALYAAIEIHEKVNLDMRLTATGDESYSYQPGINNAIVKLARAIEKIAQYEFPVSLNIVTKKYFTGLSKIKDLSLGSVLNPLLVSSQKETNVFGYADAIKKLNKHPAYRSQIRTTCEPIMIYTENKTNKVPEVAEATINCRVLSTSKPKKIFKKIKSLLSGMNVELIPIGEFESPEKPSDEKNVFYKALVDTLLVMAPEAATFPYMGLNSRDARILRDDGFNVYGFSPFPQEESKLNVIKDDTNEFTKDQAKFALEFIYRAVIDFSGEKRKL